MAAPTSDEMEEFQRLSDRYQPSLSGPLISEKLQMSDLVTEYSQADPIYITKTQALATKYMAYRRIKGDGQCGWRGAVFGYFESIMNSRNHGFAVQEFTRIKSFEETMKMAGIDYGLLEEFFDETWTLFQEILQSFEGVPDDSLITRAFNDENRSNAIVYHFKMMTSAHMALNADKYEVFAGMPMDQYRQTRIDPTLQEIDHVGLQGLTTGVIAPANLQVEVLYLDRSEGDEVNISELVPDDSNRPAIRLLYRPGHYDLIYKQDETYTVLVANNIPNKTSYQTIDSYITDEELYSRLFPGQFELGTMLRPSESSSYHQSLPANQFQYSANNIYPTDQYAEQYSQPMIDLPFEYPQQPPSNSFHQSSSNSNAYNTPSASPSTTLAPPTTIPASTNTPSTTSNGLQIRFSEFSSAYRAFPRPQFAELPVEASQYGPSAQDPSNYRNSNFAPHMYQGR